MFKNLLKKAAGNIADKAEKLGESALEKTARFADRVKESEDLLKPVEGFFGKGMKALGGIAGAAYVNSKAAYKALLEGEYSSAECKTAEDWYNRFIDNAKGHKEKISTATIDRIFEEASGLGVVGINKLNDAIVSGSDKLSEQLRNYVPTDEDYVVKIGSRFYPISKEVKSKKDLKDVHGYMNILNEKMPKNLKGRGQILSIAAVKGIKSNDDFDRREGVIYEQIRPYLQ